MPRPTMSGYERFENQASDLIARLLQLIAGRNAMAAPTNDFCHFCSSGSVCGATRDRFLHEGQHACPCPCHAALAFLKEHAR